MKKIRKGFAWAVERAGLPADVTPHIMRHSVAYLDGPEERPRT